MAGGTWEPNYDPGRPGLYLNFVEAAADTIRRGTLGTVAMPYTKTLSGTATLGGFYLVDSKTQAKELFGADNIDAILLALKGGAREVLVHVMQPSPTLEQYQQAFEEYSTRDFSVFVFDEMVSADIQDAALVWMKDNREAAGKYFMTVFGCVEAGDDADVSAGIARCTRLSDDFAVNLIIGGVDGIAILNSAQTAPYVAGLIGSTPLNASTTFAVTSFLDVNQRLRNADIKAALAKGALVLVNDGEKVKIERGLCTSGKKIRRARIQMAVATSITRTANDSFIGKMNNDEDGQIALVSAIKAYLEQLGKNGVLRLDSIVVKLSELYPSIGDKVFLDISFKDIDSMEEIYLTVQVG